MRKGVGSYPNRLLPFDLPMIMQREEGRILKTFEITNWELKIWQVSNATPFTSFLPGHLVASLVRAIASRSRSRSRIVPPTGNYFLSSGSSQGGTGGEGYF